MIGGGETAAAAQHHLIDHELSIVFADRAGIGPEARIGFVGRPRPIPGVAMELREIVCRRRCRRMETLRIEKVALDRGSLGCGFPFAFRWQSGISPGGIGGGLIKADMADRLFRIKRSR